MSARWMVTAQFPSSRPGGRGFVDGMEVHFRTAGGTEDRIFVPEAQYDADTVRALIEARVATIEAVSEL